MWKTAAMVVFRSGLLCMAVYSLVMDAKLMQKISKDTHSKSELISRCIVVIVTSPNFINALGKRRYSGSLLLSEGVDGSARGSSWSKCSPTWLSRDSLSETPSQLLSTSWCCWRGVLVFALAPLLLALLDGHVRHCPMHDLLLLVLRAAHLRDVPCDRESR